VASIQWPVSSGQYPAASIQRPVSSGQYPVAYLAWPVSNGPYRCVLQTLCVAPASLPADSIQCPVAGFACLCGQYPVASIQWHIFLGQFPVARTAAYCALFVWLPPAHQPTIFGGCMLCLLMLGLTTASQYPVALIRG
jgi:hypothetical protein